MSDSLRLAHTLMETPQVGSIVPGGPSSSELLNILRDSAIEDIAELDLRTRENRQAIEQANLVFNAQLSALASRFASLESRLPSASGRWLADFYTEDFLDGANSAEISTLYGQATLPILSAQEKLVIRDTRGQVAIPEATQVHYSYVGGTPSEVDWLRDDGVRFALDDREDTAWWQRRSTSGAVWVRIQLPPSLTTQKLANCIILHPYPALSFDLFSVEYRTPAGNWTTADLTYLSEWNGNTGKAEWIGNLRLWLPQSQVTELRLKLSAADYWGFQRLSVQQVEFEPSAILVVNFAEYDPGTLGRAVLQGKDVDTLSYLSQTLTNSTPPDGPTVSVELLQRTANTSPVITGIEVRP